MKGSAGTYSLRYAIVPGKPHARIKSGAPFRVLQPSGVQKPDYLNNL